jgi:hypothetical protein
MMTYGECLLMILAVSVLSGISTAMLINRGFGFWSFPLGIAAAILIVMAVIWLIERVVLWRRRRRP